MTGGVFAISKSEANDDIKALETFTGPSGSSCTQPEVSPACHDLPIGDDRDRFSVLSTAFFIGGAVSLVAGAVIFFAWPQRRVAAVAGGLVPYVGARSGGLTLHL